jgi:hypothetical protein
MCTWYVSLYTLLIHMVLMLYTLCIYVHIILLVHALSYFFLTKRLKTDTCWHNFILFVNSSKKRFFLFHIDIHVQRQDQVTLENRANRNKFINTNRKLKLNRISVSIIHTDTREKIMDMKNHKHPILQLSLKNDSNYPSIDLWRQKLMPIVFHSSH